MSSLRVFAPSSPAIFDPDAPVLLPFPRRGNSVATRTPRNTLPFPTIDIVARAKRIYHNRICPECRFPVVQILELDDGQFNRNGLPIPGTATLVGFQCSDCHHQWDGNQ